MDDAEIRAAEPAELPAVAGLRWRWVADRDHLPESGRAAFVTAFATWCHNHAATHHCLVVVHDRTVVGMGFLAVVPRVPTPASVSRASGDVQSVYVVPEHRGSGLGGRLIDALLGLAGHLGLERVTVHSSAGAVPAYERRGFAVSPHLLQVTPLR